jgi:hypothetical protein
LRQSISHANYYIPIRYGILKHHEKVSHHERGDSLDERASVRTFAQMRENPYKGAGFYVLKIRGGFGKKARQTAEKLVSERRADSEGFAEATAILDRELARLKTVRKHRSRRRA